jgi:exodeoxyribonuclease V alpha subunit
MASEVGFSFLDRSFGEFLAARSGLAGEARERFRQLAERVSQALLTGHSCLAVTGEEARFLGLSPLVSDGDTTPLVLHRGRLYLHRYYHYETRLAAQILAMAASPLAAGPEGELAASLFAAGEPKPDWQREAARLALRQTLTIICGGPGTGKTTTVVKILALLLEAAEGRRELAIALAAPTGKAAMRLGEAIGRSRMRLALPEQIGGRLPATASTLHRLLGVRRGSVQFHHDRENPMGWDVVVVDEASMVDLAMMSKLVDAIKPGARLILLGDKDQLASVESGAVLGDLIRGLPGNTVELRKTYRFDAHIKRLAEAINSADSAAAWAVLGEPTAASATLLDEEVIGFISNRYSRFMAAANRSGGADCLEVFALFNSFRVLSAVHYGNRGVEALNRRVELALARRGFGCRPETWYPGRPVIITRNDYGLGLYNGDIGICLGDPGSGELKVWFERADGGFLSYAPVRLPLRETVFAMTVHKSQGSEFDEVLVILPEEDNRILSRELIYTAVTRAKKMVRLVAEKEILRLALSRNIERASGLADLLSCRSDGGGGGRR